MGISCMQEVDLTPLERSPGARSSIARIGLHAPDIPRQHHIILQRSIAAMIATTRGRRRNGRRKDAEPAEPHLEVWKRGCWTQVGGCGALYSQVPGSTHVGQAEQMQASQ